MQIPVGPHLFTTEITRAVLLLISFPSLLE